MGVMKSIGSLLREIELVKKSDLPREVKEAALKDLNAQAVELYAQGKLPLPLKGGKDGL